MDEHLTAERISQLIEQPGTSSAASEHLEECPRCTAEYETMLRMRMTLSAMGSVEPPEGEWELIEGRLEEEGLLARADRPGPASVPDAPDARGRGADASGASLWIWGSWPVRAAAALVLFAGGIAAGLQLGTGGGSVGGGVLADGEADAGSRAETPVLRDGGMSTPEAGHRLATGTTIRDRIQDYLASTGGPSADPVGDPVAAAEELATLDALTQAVRESLRDRPADPTLNELLFRLTERREDLTSGFGQAARLVTLDYR